MLAGESGADYVMFGEPETTSGGRGFEAVLDRVVWWADVFDHSLRRLRGKPRRVAALAQAGADFVAIDETIWRKDLRAAMDAPARVPEPAR